MAQDCQGKPPTVVLCRFRLASRGVVLGNVFIVFDTFAIRVRTSPPLLLSTPSFPSSPSLGLNFIVWGGRPGSVIGVWERRGRLAVVHFIVWDGRPGSVIGVWERRGRMQYILSCGMFDLGAS